MDRWSGWSNGLAASMMMRPVLVAEGRILVRAMFDGIQAFRQQQVSLAAEERLHHSFCNKGAD